MLKELFAMLLLLCSLELVAVTFESKNGFRSVANDHYNVCFDGGKNFTLAYIRVNGKDFGATGEFQTRADGETETYTGRYAAIYPIIKQSEGNGATLKMLKETQEQIALQIEWNSSNGKIVQVWTFDNSPIITCDFTYHFPIRIGEMEYRLQVRRFPQDGRLTYYPMEENLSTMHYFQLAQIGSKWIHAMREDGLGVGLIAGGNEWQDIRVRSKASNKGYGQPVLDIACECRPLRYNKVPGETKGRFFMVVGANSEQARKFAANALGAFPDVEIVKVRAVKLVTKPDETNDVLVRLHSNCDKARAVMLETTLEYGLGQKRLLDRRNVELPPNKSADVRFSYKALPSDRWGNIVRATVKDGENVISQRGDCCAVTDFPPEVQKYVFVDATEFQPRYESAMEDLAEYFRRGLWGGIEVYCWAPDTLDGLAAKEDTWFARTESQGTHESQVSKKSIVDFNRAAHECGLSSFCWITGICNYYEAVKHPENLVYNANGQPNIYNGNVYNGRRYTTTLLNAYSPDYATMWAECMNKSIDMFGWDGCRWDWNFLADAPNDPIWRPEKLPPWRDFKGTPADKLYPNPDALGVEALRSWRETVARKHPDFIFCSNYMASPEILKRYPKYFGETVHDSMVLYEYLHDPNKPPYKTFELWGRAIAEATQEARRHKGRVVVGNMFERLRPYTVSLNLARYVCAAAGGSFCGTYVYASESEEADRFVMRFSEHYFDTALLSVPDNEIDSELQVEEAGRILYKPFVYRREKDGCREIVAHLINQPENDEICRRHLPPTIRRDFAVRVSPNAKNVWYATPQGGDLPLQLQTRNGKVVIPVLIDAGILVIKE